MIILNRLALFPLISHSIMQQFALLLLLLNFFYHSEASECTGLPTDSSVESLLQPLVDSDGGEGAGRSLTIQDGPYYTCQAQGTTEGTYRELSIIAAYNFPDDGDFVIRVRQFELDCVEVSGSRVWDGRRGSLSSIDSALDYMNIVVMTNCSECTSSAGNDHHCQACDPDCNMGLMRCTGSSSSDCCVAFNNGVCSPDFNFYCEDSPCANGGTCIGIFDGYTCICPVGFTGENCTVNIDECASDPCFNGGTCIDQVAGYTCVCVEGFAGENCSVNIDDCANDLCFNGGTCIDQVAGYTCVCAEGFAGENCSVNIDDCANDPCLNGGICIDQIASYTCICAEGFTGENCSMNIDECANDPCFNGGICIDQVAGYTCVCAEGFTGENCSMNIDDCANDPCFNGGTCIDQIAGYICVCVEGFAGENCSVNIDDCANDPCFNGGTCIDQIASYTCICAEGFAGENCSVNIDDCANDPCFNGGTCIDQVASYTCVCAEGFTGNTCAVDIDECLNDPCENGGTCVNTSPFYLCLCIDGYTGTNCETFIDSEDECSPACPSSDLFEKNLCLFYCNLASWRDVANEHYLSLPEIEEDLDGAEASNEERWRHAVTQQERFSRLWSEAARDLIPLSDEQDSQEEYEDLVSEWVSRANENQDQLQSWREYARTLAPHLEFQELPVLTVNQDSTEEDISHFYNSYNDVWSNDLGTFVAEFGN